jgi:tRNA nucleotidyltransferase (CCA-adding enzyme)
MNNLTYILHEIIKKTRLDEKTENKIKSVTKDLVNRLRKKIKKDKISATVFIGGSLAKKTIIKKDKYDVDIFIRFDKIYENQNLTQILEKLLSEFSKFSIKKIHGSRDYFQIIVEDNIFEIIPVLKINNPKDSKNVTDLSYFHVNYILKRIKKNKSLPNQIIVTKAFVHASNCYGAESYIKGFSGYSLELLICHYKSFHNFVKAIANLSFKEKLIIDDSKFYSNKKNVLLELNESKISSPIILIDPTFKERNVLAGLSKETLIKFQKICVNFLKKPSLSFFKNIDPASRFKDNNSLRIISIKTSKQKGDIAGTKSKKFYNFLNHMIKKEFVIKDLEFVYDEKENIAYFYYIVDKKPEEIIKGPKIEDKINLDRFKKSHPNSFIKNNVSYAAILHNLNFEDFFNNLIKKDNDILNQMSIKIIKLEK